MSYEQLEQISTPDFVIAVALADVHRDPDGDSELVTQALLNTPLRAGETSGDWTAVTLPDYSGWVRSAELEEPIVRGFCEGDAGTCGVPLPYSVVVTAPHTPLYRSEHGDQAFDTLYLSTVLPYIDLGHPERLHVALPGERSGWVARDAVEVRANTQLFPRQEIASITSYAKAFLGVPYLWGGTSWRGIDCSALMQLCYRVGGYSLPRDGDQQHDALALRVEREAMQMGDLLFFGRDSIVHVALALNRYEYIHADGQVENRVTINSLDPAHPAYSSHLAERIWAVKRVQGL